MAIRESNHHPRNLLGSCHVCGHHGLDYVAGFETLRCVTSDCKPIDADACLCLCPACGTVQKTIDDTWRGHTEKIYRAYDIYHQSQGREQMVFESESGKASPRSQPIFDFVNASVGLRDTGRLLDIGCGNGSFLKIFSKVLPKWVMFGHENCDMHKKAVEAIEGVETLYSCKVRDIPGPFKLITLIHVLEHIADPASFLNELLVKLADDGLVVVQVPNWHQNPFDLLIFDHCTHFDPETLANTARKAGYDIIAMSAVSIPKELTLILKPGNKAKKAVKYPNKNTRLKESTAAVDWLKQTRKGALEASKTKRFGIFGTSIAGTWLFSELDGAADFFVDEDMGRVGKTHMGYPVFHPVDLFQETTVYIPLPHEISIRVKRRLAMTHSGGIWISTPTLKQIH
jgi:trans-aconitate methyltransferase